MTVRVTLQMVDTKLNTFLILLNLLANKNGTDQLAVNKITILYMYLVSVAEQADLCMTFSQTAKLLCSGLFISPREKTCVQGQSQINAQTRLLSYME